VFSGFSASILKSPHIILSKSLDMFRVAKTVAIFSTNIRFYALSIPYMQYSCF
jgi:hypothetical protein